MSIYKHENGRYYYNFMIDGRRYHGACKTTDPKIARKIELEAMDAVCRGNSEYFKKKNILKLKQAADVYLNYSKNNNLGYKTDKAIVEKIIEFWGANKDIEQLSPTEIDDFKAFLTNWETYETIKVPNPEYGKAGVRKKFIYKKQKITKERSNATKNRYIAVLNRMFNLCIENKLLSQNPCYGIKKLRENNKQRRVLEADEEKRIFEAINSNTAEFGYLKDIILFALQTGARKQNVLNIEWKHINFKDGMIKFLKTKSGKAYEVPMTKKLEAMLKKRFAVSESEYVFVNPETNQPYKDIKKSFKSLMKAANVENFTLHCCRHTVGTEIIEKTGDIIAAQEILGHSNIKTTLIYHHINEERKRKAIEVLNR